MWAVNNHHKAKLRHINLVQFDPNAFPSLFGAMPWLPSFGLWGGDSIQLCDFRPTVTDPWKVQRSYTTGRSPKVARFTQEIEVRMLKLSSPAISGFHFNGDRP